MARESDLELFPNARDVVRVDDARWSQVQDLHQELTHHVGTIVHGSKSIAEMSARLKSGNPRVAVDDVFAYLLYAPEPFRIDKGKVSLDVRGIVFEPRIRISRKGNIVVDL